MFIFHTYITLFYHQKRVLLQAATTNDKSMKTTILAMLLLASCILAACTRSSPNIQLVQADSLIQKFPDSALHFLQGIQPKGLHLAADRAYYALLLTQVKDKNFIHQTEDSLIRIAVQYYDSTKNTAMQARAHYLNPEKPVVPLNKNDAFQKVQKRRVQEKR